MKKNEEGEGLSVFEQIKQGLEQSIAHARGELTLKTTVLATPAPTWTKSRVKAVRKKTRMSQAVFASYLNVPTKTLQSWEQGARTPKAGDARLLQIVDANPEEFESTVLQVEQVKLRSGRVFKAKSATSRTSRRVMS